MCTDCRSRLMKDERESDDTMCFFGLSCVSSGALCCGCASREVPGSSPFHPGKDSGSSMYLLADSENRRTHDKLTKEVTQRQELRRTVLRIEKIPRAPKCVSYTIYRRTWFQGWSRSHPRSVARTIHIESSAHPHKARCKLNEKALLQPIIQDEDVGRPNKRKGDRAEDGSSRSQPKSRSLSLLPLCLSLLNSGLREHR